MAETSTPIQVGNNTPITDTLAAAGRYLVAIIAAFPALLALLGDRDLGAIIAYFRSDAAAPLIAAVIGLFTIAYGLIKTRRRASQLHDVAANPNVPSSVASLK